jgi:hypothetical protein
MARVSGLRAATFSAAVIFAASTATYCDRIAVAQAVGPWQAPMQQQPMYMQQAPMFQVGPSGAVNLDQPMMAQGYPGYAAAPANMYGMPAGAMYQPYAAGPGCGDACSVSCGQPCGQPCPQPMQWVVPMQPTVPCPPPCAPQPPPIQWMVFGDVLWLQPTGVDMAHAQQQDGIGGAGTVPFGTIGVVDPGYDIGFRVGGELQFDPCAAIFLQYAFFDESAENTLEPPVIPGGGGAVGSLVHHPGAAVTGSVGPVTGEYDIEFQLGDAAYRQYLIIDNCRKVSVFGGGRFGHLEQDFLQTGVFAGGQGGQIDTSTNIDFTGGGPMAGIDAERRIDQSGFSVYGRALVAALTGNFDSTYRMFNSTTGTLLAQADWEEDRIVPMLDYELGIAWTGPQGHLRLAVGYMASHWFNAVTTPVFVDAVQADNYTDVSDTVSFDGLVGHVEFRW